jgi:hypothetical protein
MQADPSSHFTGLQALQINISLQSPLLLTGHFDL